MCTNAEQWLKLRIMKFQKTFHGYRSLCWWKESFLKLPSGNPLLYAISEPHTFPVCCFCFHSPPALTFVVSASLDHHWLLMAVTSKVTCMLENCHANSTENFPSRNYKESEATAGRSLGLFISNSGYSIISDSWGELVVFLGKHMYFHKRGLIFSPCISLFLHSWKPGKIMESFYSRIFHVSSLDFQSCGIL